MAEFQRIEPTVVIPLVVDLDNERVAVAFLEKPQAAPMQDKTNLLLPGTRPGHILAVSVFSWPQCQLLALVPGEQVTGSPPEPVLRCLRQLLGSETLPKYWDGSELQDGSPLLEGSLQPHAAHDLFAPLDTANIADVEDGPFTIAMSALWHYWVIRDAEGALLSHPLANQLGQPVLYHRTLEAAQAYLRRPLPV